MRDFEQRIDIVEVNLPEPEDLNLFRVQGREIDGCVTRAEQKDVTLMPVIPMLLQVDHSFAHAIGRRITAIVVGISGLFRLC